MLPSALADEETPNWSLESGSGGDREYPLETIGGSGRYANPWPHTSLGTSSTPSALSGPGRGMA